ncbi:response regulator [Rhizobium grahamii]|uniref:Response regulator receiver protein n=2 Tax=Rhizobium grahamii TaxID=1120045 RepID=S3HD06_9HYPH|nr:response regulator [Rhizobium grahamii]EPE96632.1 response regulator receiver protein [Rhizobium grahamii CCGE 502]RDJ03863.1 response regulator [Rhizobium grahamii]
MARILVVEDEPLIRFALADELADEGHVVIECCNVLEAVAALGMNDCIDAVVTDVDMPGGLSGVDLARMLAIVRPSVPVWMTSGRDVDVSEFGETVVFMPKPYDLAALRNGISTRLRANEKLKARTLALVRSRSTSF